MRMLLGLYCCLATMLGVAVGGERRPNIVVILADDQGWGDLSVHGNTNLATPNIDSLAKHGALFERFFVCPVCSPTRAEFLTGRYHLRGGVRNVTSGGERLDLDELTLAQALRTAGYATGAFGKWHNGSQYPYHPNGRGFEEYYGFTSGHWGDYFEPPLDHNGQPTLGRGFLPDDLTDHALEYMRRHQDRPFFCYVPFNTPHSPMQVPDSFFAKFAQADLKLLAREPRKEDLPFTRAALAMCENLDWNVGRLLRGLEELNLVNDTIVIYFSDNGPNSERWNGGMKGRKGSTDEGGVRSPLLVRWPGKIAPGQRIPQIAGAIDLFPTLLELANIKLDTSLALDGRSLKPLLCGEKTNWTDRSIFSHWGGKTSVRTQNYRLDANGHLFDMRSDPGQERNIASEHPHVAERLTKQVTAWKQELSPKLTRDDRPFTVGYAEFPLTILPARDGVPHGTIRRSAKAPNCSFFENWTSTEDRLTWEIEVATAGNYEVVLDYTCRQVDLGAKLELTFQDRTLLGKTLIAHDPPLRGQEHDRVPRQSESFVKTFQPWRFGEISLPAGRGELTLRALEIPGERVIDLRAVRLLLKP